MLAQDDRPRTAHAIAGRYLLLSQVASGGMASVHLGRVLGAAGFSNVVAIKRLHPHLAKEPEVVARFLDEARLAARVKHANVVAILDVVQEDGEVFLVMEYVLGASVSQLLRTAQAGAPPDVAAAIIASTLEGLHAAHEARGDEGSPLGIVHRDVSPQNVIVGADGAVRVVDFGIAKATGQAQVTRDGELKGKAAYMPPEQIRGKPLDRRADVYAAGVVLWELLTGRRLFSAEDPLTIMLRVCEEEAPPPSRFAPVPWPLDEVVRRALAKAPDDRFATAHDFADALERALPIATARGVARWVDSIAGPEITARAKAMDAAAQTPSIAPAPRASMPSTSEVAAARLTEPAHEGLDAVETDTTHPDVRPARRGWRAGVLVAVLLGTALTGIAFGRRPVATTEIPPATAASPKVADSLENRVAPTAASIDNPGPAAQVDTSLEPAPGASGPRRNPKPGVVRNCNPPWTLAPDGIKILKPECR